MNLAGKKTYILGIVILSIAIVAAKLQLIDTETVMELIAIALLAMGLKSGQSRLETHL